MRKSKKRPPGANAPDNPGTGAAVKTQANNYTGRFAPSPTGPLHFGSLVTAVASFLDARANKGRWLVRIDDIDPPREQPGAADAILAALSAHGLEWDGEVLYQSNRTALYLNAAQQLLSHRHAYYCDCSRQQLKGLAAYPGTCRGLHKPAFGAAVRVMTDASPVLFTDIIQGSQQCRLGDLGGDFIILRKDGLVAYQLAAALDDHSQLISHIIRGHDLLESTFRQLHLMALLGLEPPQYGHIPIIVDTAGQKLSKQNLAAPLDLTCCSTNLYYALTLLGQQPPTRLRGAPPNTLLAWATDRWRIKDVPKSKHLAFGVAP